MKHGRDHSPTFAAKAATGRKIVFSRTPEFLENLGCSVAYEFLITESDVKAFLGVEWGGV